MTSVATPAPSVLAGLRRSLVAHAPFASMREADLDAIVSASTIRYYEPGETVLAPTRERPAHCFVVRQGSVRAEPAGPGSEGGDAKAHWVGNAGDMFPVNALIQNRGATSVYKAAGDTFVLLFPAAVFDALVESAPVFADFCTRRLAHLVDLSRASVQAEYAAAVTGEHGLATPLGELLRQPPVTVAPSLPLEDALRMMESHRIGSLPVVDASQRPIGIFTRQDVIGRVVLARRRLDTPIGEVASAPVVVLSRAATAGDAALDMARRAIRHIVVVDALGSVVGVVSERDLFGLQRLSVRELAADIRRAADLDVLVHCAADIRALSHALVAQGVASGQLTRMISSLNDQLLHRLLDLVAPRHDLGGVRLCWIGMGSEGRNEQTIATDQDNGIVFEADGASPDAVRDRLLPFAREVNDALDSCGYPRCKGNVMAGNPRWCAALAEWQRDFHDWIDQGDPESLLAATIFFDFRSLWGETALAHALRTDIAARAKANSRFLKQMADNAQKFRPPLNWLGVFSTRNDVSGSDAIDLKIEGTAIFVDAARILALASGVTATSTVERLRQAGAAHPIPAAEVRNWIDAFEYLQLLRLRTQHRRAQGALAPNANANLLPLDDLSDLDRRIVKEALRQARKLQQRLELDYPG